MWTASSRSDVNAKALDARLVEGGIEKCRRAGFEFVVVLGDPRYYKRFGFAPARSFGLENDYGVDEEFMALRRGALKGICGVVKYASEFSRFEQRPPVVAGAPKGSTTI